MCAVFDAYDKTFSLYVLFDIAQALEVPVGKLLE